MSLANAAATFLSVVSLATGRMVWLPPRVTTLKGALLRI